MPRPLRRVRQYGVLVVVSALSLYYLYRAVHYRFVVPDRLGPSLFNKQVWYVSHLLLALPVDLGAPLPFVAPLRRRAPQWHREIGKGYVVVKHSAAHRAFMIRSFAMALVLVWLRLMYDWQDLLFFYVTNPDLRDAICEWASWVVPLLAVEMWLAWYPAVRRNRMPIPPPGQREV